MLRSHYLRSAALLAALALPRTVAAEESADQRIFIVGDSHVQMLGPMLARRLERDGFVVEGWESRPGWSTARYRRCGDLGRLLVAHGRPEIVVVSLGGNDIVSSRRRYRRELVWVVEQARAAGAAQVVWLGPATSDGDASSRAAATGARHERNAELQRQILPDLGVKWVDSRPLTRANHRRDGVHFTRAGYSSWATAILSDVERAIPRPEPDVPVGGMA